MEKAEIYNRAEKLTKELVGIKSVNGCNDGERRIADYLEDYLKKIPYFKEHPDNIIKQEIPGDNLNRCNVFAYITGKKNKSNKTIIWHGHIDTVGTEDYGELEQYATDCDKLLEEILKLNLSKEIRNDLQSGDWLVGRGACDMKSGVAVFAVLLEYLSERLDSFGGNILFSANPVEENQHTGIIAGIKVLEQLKNEKNFDYVMAINNDYICPLYENDRKKYIYTGAVGKLLPCFYIQGYETHVGQCFEGFDASVAAAEVVRLVNYNTDLCDSYNGEYTLPPSVLKMKDLKSSYNVQTAQEAYVYFNYFVHSKSVETIISELKEIGRTAMNNVADKITEENIKYAKLSGDNISEKKFIPEILTYDELIERVESTLSVNANELADELAKELLAKNIDFREISLNIVQKLADMLKTHNPLMVVFLSAPYCPYNTLHEEVEEEQKIYDKLAEITSVMGKELDEEFEIRQFFPSLSDSSYLKISDSSESMEYLKGNFPAMSTLYPLPINEIMGLNIPAVNFGVYGKDAHKWSERLYKPYSFGKLPILELEAVKRVLGE